MSNETPNQKVNPIVAGVILKRMGHLAATSDQAKQEQAAGRALRETFTIHVTEGAHRMLAALQAGISVKAMLPTGDLVTISAVDVPFVDSAPILAKQLKNGQSFMHDGRRCRCVCVHSATVEIETVGTTKTSFIHGDEEVTIIPE